MNQFNKSIKYACAHGDRIVQNKYEIQWALMSKSIIYVKIKLTRKPQCNLSYIRGIKMYLTFFYTKKAKVFNPIRFYFLCFVVYQKTTFIKN